jgi:hypothetical protein
MVGSTLQLELIWVKHASSKLPSTYNQTSHAASQMQSSRAVCNGGRVYGFKPPRNYVVNFHDAFQQSLDCGNFLFIRL